MVTEFEEHGGHVRGARDTSKPSRCGTVPHDSELWHILRIFQMSQSIDTLQYIFFSRDKQKVQ